MGLFSSREKIHISDMPEFLCDAVLTLAWQEKTPNISKEYGYIEREQMRFAQFRTIAITSAYYYTFFRMNLVSNIELTKLEEILIKSREMFPKKFGDRTLFIYEDEDAENIKNMLKQAYNNAIQSIIETNTKSTDEIPYAITKEYIIELYKEANLTKEEMEKIIEINQQRCAEITKNMYIKTRNISSNIKITNKDKYKGKYVSYEVEAQQKKEKLLSALNGTEEEKIAVLMDILKNK